MKKILMGVAIATLLLGGHGTASASKVSVAVADTIADGNGGSNRGNKGLGDLLGSFLGGGAAKKNNEKAETCPEKPDSVVTPEQPGKDALGGILGSLLGGAKGGSDDKKDKIGDALGSLFDGIAGNKLSAEMLVGTWDYNGSKCVLKADDIVKKMGSEAMVAPIEKKLNGYLEKAGFKSGNFSYTFKEDSTFTAQLGSGRPINGTYALDLENKTITLKLFKAVKTTLTLTVVNQKLGMLHDADKLLDLVRIVASKSSSMSIKSINNLLGSYDGLQIGMEFKKAQ